MAIVKKIVDLMGGDIDVQSERERVRHLLLHLSIVYPRMLRMLVR